MRRAALILAAAASLAACQPAGPDTSATGGQSVIVVRDFHVTAQTRVSVDTSLGFSLQRGQPGVPLAQRAAGAARAAAFGIADTLTERLRQLGYAAVRADAETPNPSGKSLIVVGTMREVDEGFRRRIGNENAKVAVDVEIDEWSPGIKPVLALHVDSSQLAADGIGAPAGEAASALNAAAARVGREIARPVADLARREGIARAAPR